MRNVCLLIFGVVTGVSALVNAYHIDPQTAAMSGKVSGNPEYDGVSQVLTTNFDEPITASLFCGSPGAGGRYHVSVLTYPDGYPIAHGDTASPRDHSWATCTPYVDFPDSFIKGRQVEVRWTRSGDSIQYYYNYCATRYDSMAAAEKLDSRPAKLRIA